jgi:hypothetical protein
MPFLNYYYMPDNGPNKGWRTSRRQRICSGVSQSLALVEPIPSALRVRGSSILKPIEHTETPGVAISCWTTIAQRDINIIRLYCILP